MNQRFSALAIMLVAKRKSRGRRVWRLIWSLSYREGEDVTTVLRGFETDFASSPRWCWRVFSPTDAPEAATLHDWLYRCGTCTRREADRRFREAMAATGVASWRRWLAWLAVRIFGWLTFGAARANGTLELK